MVSSSRKSRYRSSVDSFTRPFLFLNSVTTGQDATELAAKIGKREPLHFGTRLALAWNVGNARNVAEQPSDASRSRLFPQNGTLRPPLSHTASISLSLSLSLSHSLTRTLALSMTLSTHGYLVAHGRFFHTALRRDASGTPGDEIKNGIVLNARARSRPLEH